MGTIAFRCIAAGTHRSEVSDAPVTTSIKETVVEMSDTPVKQVFLQAISACCVVTPAAGASQWEIVLMFSRTATLPLHQYLSCFDR